MGPMNQSKEINLLWVKIAELEKKVKELEHKQRVEECNNNPAMREVYND